MIATCARWTRQRGSWVLFSADAGSAHEPMHSTPKNVPSVDLCAIGCSGPRGAAICGAQNARPGWGAKHCSCVHLSCRLLNSKCAALQNVRCRSVRRPRQACAFCACGSGAEPWESGWGRANVHTLCKRREDGRRRFCQRASSRVGVWARLHLRLRQCGLIEASLRPSTPYPDVSSPECARLSDATRLKTCRGRSMIRFSN